MPRPPVLVRVRAASERQGSDSSTGAEGGSGSGGGEEAAPCSTSRGSAANNAYTAKERRAGEREGEMLLRCRDVSIGVTHSPIDGY
jgi:hypothetical protein